MEAFSTAMSTSMEMERPHLHDSSPSYFENSFDGLQCDHDGTGGPRESVIHSNSACEGENEFWISKSQLYKLESNSRIFDNLDIMTDTNRRSSFDVYLSSHYDIERWSEYKRSARRIESYGYNSSPDYRQNSSPESWRPNSCGIASNSVNRDTGVSSIANLEHYEIVRRGEEEDRMSMCSESTEKEAACEREKRRREQWKHNIVLQGEESLSSSQSNSTNRNWYKVWHNFRRSITGTRT
ncbi:hypothetical protein BT63DRAFT_422195 [Microthyrium microscopicum]|uniref:Uncharacterized protein n=1 Tax=Microthyrium microscopicum TaxID=703497 RepID=A0A6A6UJK6_9PEZI|nr:hypothetical protein BT63DRAFT_422195 [Microthyrium microscopicum]